MPLPCGCAPGKSRKKSLPARARIFRKLQNRPKFVWEKLFCPICIRLLAKYAILWYNSHVYNGQGDVIGLTKADGTLVMGYTYGAWGTATGLAMDAELTNILITVNPFTYRGYVYDTGTSLYYLQSRYYDPELGRFINADAYASTGQGVLGNNMFAYCLNNPLFFVDHDGLIAEWIPVAWEDVEEKVEEYLTTSNTFGAMLSGASIALSLVVKSVISQLRASPRPANIGIGIYLKRMHQEIAYLQGQEAAAAKLFYYLSYGAVALDVYYGVAQNIEDGASTGKILYDASVDVAITGGTIWIAGAAGAKLGSIAGVVFPGAGNVIGGIAGFVVGIGIYALTDMTDYNGKTAREWLKGLVR